MDSIGESNIMTLANPLSAVKLICCIGVSTDEFFSLASLQHFLHHYLGLGVRPNNFLLTLHGADESREINRIDDLLSHLGISPPNRISGEYDCYKFHEQNMIFLSTCSKQDWIILVDLDEFVEFPRSLPGFVIELETKGLNLVIGNLVDRVAKNGVLVEIDEAIPIWDQYPEKYRITREILRGLDQKICMFKNVMCPNIGHHLIETTTVELKPYEQLLNVHHFKWDDTIRQRLTRTLERFRKNPSRYWWAEEVERALGRISDERICLDDCTRIT